MIIAEGSMSGRFCFAVSVSIGFLCCGPGAWAAESLKIPFIATLSGPAAQLGIDSVDGFKLAIKDGKLGGVPVELVVMDDELKPEIGIGQAKKAVERDKAPIVVGTTFSNILMAIVAPVTKANAILISENAGPSPLAGAQCNPSFFSVAFLNDQIYEPVGAYLQKKGIKNAVVLAPNYQAGRDAIAGFKHTFKGEILDELYTPLNQLDFAAELTRIASLKPEVVFAFYPGGLAVNFVKQYAQAGLNKTIPLYGGFPLADETVRKAQGNAALGIVTSGNWSADLNNPANAEFVAAFKKAYGRNPSEYAAYGYDVARLIESALTKVNGDTSNLDALRAAVKAADFKSVRGNFRFNSNQFPVTDWHVQQVVEDGAGTRNKVLETIFTSAEDRFAGQCQMK
jgi:branched-chain amino acid transport system substrate-binding protein